MRLVLVPRLLLLLASTACVSHRPIDIRGDSARSYPRVVRVTRTDRRSVVLFDARAEGDSLVGNSGSAAAPRIAIAMADIRSVEEQRHDTRGNAVIVILVVLAVVAAALSAIGSMDLSGPASP